MPHVLTVLEKSQTGLHTVQASVGSSAARLYHVHDGRGCAELVRHHEQRTLPWAGVCLHFEHSVCDWAPVRLREVHTA